MAWPSSKFRREALVVVVLVLHWCTIDEVSAMTEPLISFGDDQPEDVVILNIAEGQFILDDLNVTLGSSINEDTELQLDITLLNKTSFSEIDIDEPAARADDRIPLDFRFNYTYNGGTRTITLSNLDIDTTLMALDSLTYTYSSNVFPESFSGATSDVISITLTQDGNSSTIYINVQYRGENLAPPVLYYIQTGNSSVTYTEGDNNVYIINGSVTIIDTDHPSYLLQSGTVEIVNYRDEDQLSIINATLKYTYKDGVLNITEPAGIEEYLAAINSIVYNNTAAEPLSDVKTIRITVTDSPVFTTENPTSNNLTIANSSISNAIELTVIVVNVDEVPYPILNNLYLTEVDGPVKINLTTVDLTDPLDNYTTASLTLIPAFSEIESIGYDGPELNVTIDDQNLIVNVTGLRSKEDYNYIFRNVTYQWDSTNGNLDAGNLTFMITDCSNNTMTVMANIFVYDVMDNIPIFGFASDEVDRNSELYPTMLSTDKFINYDVIEPIKFLNNTYLRDDRQLKNITIEVNTSVRTTDKLLWDQTLQNELEIEYTNTSSELTSKHVFSANISDRAWEKFLMSFCFLQNATRAADRNAGNRTITVLVQDCTNDGVEVTIIINVLPLPPEVTIILVPENITFTEGEQSFIFQNSYSSIGVIQDQDAMFVSLTISLQIAGEEGAYQLGDTEMLYTIIPPTNPLFNEDSTPHMIIFSNEMGISNRAARQAIQSIIYFNDEDEPRAFDNTGAPLLRRIVISTVDMLSRSFQKSFYIRIIPFNDKRPVIRLFTSENCSTDSTTAPSRKKRTATPQQSQRIKHHSAMELKHQMAPYITELYGVLTDDNCAAYIVIHFSAPVSHPYVDIWPRLSLVLSLSPRYLSNQQPTGTWDGQDILIISFPEHNCSKWNYNNSHIIFKQSNDPCHSPVECLTGICYSNYSGCRLTGTFAVNFTTGHSRQTAAIDCLYPPTSAPLLADTWVVNILVVMVIFLLGTIFFYCIWKYVAKRLHLPKEEVTQTPANDKLSNSVKHYRNRLNKSSTIALIASTPVAKRQQVNDVPTVTQKRSHDCYHGDHILLLDKDDNDVHDDHLEVKKVESKAVKAAVSSPDTTEHKAASKIKDKPDVTTLHNTSDKSHDAIHNNKTDTPRRPVVNDSAFRTDAS